MFEPILMDNILESKLIAIDSLLMFSFIKVNLHSIYYVLIPTNAPHSINQLKINYQFERKKLRKAFVSFNENGIWK